MHPDDPAGKVSDLTPIPPIRPADYGQYPLCYRAFNSPARNEGCEGCPVQQTFHDGLGHELERETLTSRGSRVLRITSTALTAPDGQVAAAIEMVDDITVLKRQEKEEKALQRVREEVGRMQTEEDIREVLVAVRESLEQLAVPFSVQCPRKY